jgi:methylated-DNA-[protein]-cysteine S-methyltransferase
MTLQSEFLETETGRLVIVSDERQLLCAIDWDDNAARMGTLLGRHFGAAARAIVTAAGPSPAWRALRAYFDGVSTAIDALPTAVFGTEFQRKVWAALRRIPAGTTATYSALAAQIGQPTAVRAVGLANGANPIAIVVPCHRVIGADGSLTGYASGLERKRWLLVHERG